MSVIRVKGFQIFTDRHGKLRCYHRRTRTAVDMVKAPLGSAEFFAECARISALAQIVDTAKPGTLGGLINAYRASVAFRADIKAVTRVGYQRVFDYLKRIEDTPLARFNSPFIVKMRDRAEQKHKRHFANSLKTVLSLLFAWGKERGLMKENPAAGIRSLRRPKGMPKQNRRWSDAERDAVLAAMPPHILPAIGLMMFTGLGPEDALSLPRTAYRQGKIYTARSKTDVGVIWPAIDQLKAVLDAAPQHDAITLCANSDGKPWTTSGFRASWRKQRIKLEEAGAVQAGLTLYGLRHTVATILRETGMSPRAIADALGQKTEAMALHYSKEADLSKAMEKTSKRFEREVNNRRTLTVKPEGK